MRKLDVINAIRLGLQVELDAMARANSLARDEATNNKPENKYDTRALEASYLASAQVDGMVDLKQLIGFYEMIEPKPCSMVQVGALVELEDEEGSQWLFVAPQGGGQRVAIDGETVTVLSAGSPLGKAITGLEVDDDATWETPTGRRSLDIISVA